MTHYSENPGHVQANRFKESGKWYDTFSLDMTLFYDDIAAPQAVYNALLNKFGIDWVENHPGWSVVVLDPYHRNSHPVMIKLGVK